MCTRKCARIAHFTAILESLFVVTIGKYTRAHHYKVLCATLLCRWFFVVISSQNGENTHTHRYIEALQKNRGPGEHVNRI